MPEQRVDQTASLTTLGGGAAIEMFDDALGKVVANILDLNTDPTGVRKVSLVVTIKPKEDRETCEVLLEANTKLAGMKPVSEVMWVGREAGQPKGTVRHADPKDPRQNVLQMTTKEGA